MAVALEQLIKQLTDSGIIAPGKLENFVPPKAHPKSAEELLRQLVAQNHLTRFQAQHVLAGKGKALFLGNYTVLDRVGAGGMGQVFKAEHRRMKRVVAIKMLPPTMTKNAAALARFQREVEAAAKLSHPNIVAAYDADEANGAHFLVMEYVEGKDLSALVKKNGPCSTNKAVNYVLQVARGLEFAHKKGVVHRDIKPANLLLDNHGTAKILDMGLARVDAGSNITAQAELTGTDAVMGTVDYMAPEQGVSTKNAGAQADIYSLGCSLHYLLIGKPVYSSETIAAKLLAHHQHPIPDLHKLRDDVPEKLAAVFRKMVAKNIDDRYQTMKDVITDLEHCQAALGAIAASDTADWIPPSRSDDPLAMQEPQRTLRGRKKNAPPSRSSRRLIGAGAAGFFAVLLGVIFIFKNDKGEETARILLPESGSVEVRGEPAAGSGQHSAKPGNAAAVPPKSATGSVIASPAPLVAPFDAEQAHASQEAWASYLKTTVEQKNTVGMTLVLIPPGEFLMGSAPEQEALGRKMVEDAQTKADSWDLKRLKEEGPQHRVTLTRPYWLDITEVTVGQFKKFVDATKYITEAEQFGFGSSMLKKADATVKPNQKKMTWRTPGQPVNDDSPVTQVTWSDAVQFCNWLSEQEKLRPHYRQDANDGWMLLPSGDGYRLPTEAEWEYACRAGTTTQFSFGNDVAQLNDFGWYKKNFAGGAKAVGLKRPNGFGLYDMHGNLFEWCHDWYVADYYSVASPSDPTGPASGNFRMIRGGDWIAEPVRCRSAYRDLGIPEERNWYQGFRVVRVVAGDVAAANTVPATSGRLNAPTKPKSPQPALSATKKP